MNDQERELDLMVAELEQENRLLRARNERLEAEQHLQALHDENVRLGLYEQGEPTGMLHIDRLDKWLDASLNKRKQRTWVDLTDDEISACSKGHMTRNAFARAIEAKLKQKNTSEAKLKEIDI